MKLNILLLTCSDSKEADNISKTLLDKKLIACSKKTSVSSSFLWKGKIDNSKEVLLIMDSIEENFNKVNTEVKKIHSYETFALTSIPITKTTKKVKNWINTQLR